MEDRVLIGETGPDGSAFRLRWWMIVRYLVLHLQLRMRGRFGRFGYAAVVFGRPISLHRFMWEGHADPAAALGDALMIRIEAALPVLPTALVCEALLNGARDVDTVAIHLGTGIAQWQHAGHVVHHGKRDQRETALIALRMLELRGIVAIDGTRIVPRQDQTAILSFYAATLPRAPGGNGTDAPIR